MGIIVYKQGRATIKTLLVHLRIDLKVHHDISHTMTKISLIVVFFCVLAVVSSMPQPGGWGYNPGNGGNGGGGNGGGSYNPGGGGNGCNGNTRPDYHGNGCNDQHNTNGGNGHHNGNTRPDYHGK